MMRKMFEQMWPGHSMTDGQALAWADGAVLTELPSEWREDREWRDQWRKVGEVDGGMAVVWYDSSADEYLFEDRYNPVSLMRDMAVTSANFRSWLEFAAEFDWGEFYDLTKEDGEPTDATGDLGDMIIAAYWWAHDHHGGQGSQEYRLLSALSEVHTPGPSTCGPEKESTEHDMYLMLERAVRAL